MMKFIPTNAYKCGLLGLLLLLAETVAVGQIQSSTPNYSEPKHLVKANAGAVCEMNNLYIDWLVVEAKKSKDRIFIISRPGRGEANQLSWNRLEAASFFLTDGKQIVPSQIVTAIGARTSNGIGRLEFYLGSQLFLVSEAKKGKGVCLNCCPV